jgi:ParB family chromosome partitioning protein
LPGTALDAGERAGEDALSKSTLYRFDRDRLLGRVADLDVDAITPNPYQPRTHFDETALDELSISIAQLGIIQPITVRSVGEGQFQIISGERRLRAARRAGLKRIPAYVREADSESMLEMAIVENIQREDLNPIETALGYQRLLDECNLTQEDVAQKVGKKRSTIANALRLLRLPPPIQAGLRDRVLSSGHARMLVSLEDEETQIKLFQRILDEGLSVRSVERMVRQLQKAETGTSQPKEAEEPLQERPDVEILQVRNFTNQLRSRFGTHVAIRHKPDESGKIELTYYSNEDLERLLELLLGEL